jgi:hypothetical protein
MRALRRWWDWETRLFRKDGRTRPGERLGLAMGMSVIVLGVVLTVVSISVR